MSSQSLKVIKSKAINLIHALEVIILNRISLERKAFSTGRLLNDALLGGGKRGVVFGTRTLVAIGVI